MKRALLLILAIPMCAIAQGPPPLPPSGNGAGDAQTEVIQQTAPPVIINGKPADQMTDDEKLEFLQEKVKTISQEDGQVELLRVAPGYPLTLSFEEPIMSVIVGDTAMVKTENLNPKTLVISPTSREGDTSMQVFFSGNLERIYHIFIADSFVNGETAIKIRAFGSGESSPESSIAKSVAYKGSDELDIRMIAQVIRNYDALVMEKAIDSRSIRRFSIFRKSPITSFTTYYIYRFSNGPAAITFSYKNPYPYPIRYDESRLRLAIGNVTYVPDYVSLQKTNLGPGDATSGFAVISKPVFSFDQPFELVWK
jgi:hypothetical protein